MIKWFMNLFKKKSATPKVITQLEPTPKTEPIKTVGKPKGFDISHHNGNVDFNLFASLGYSFVYLKASEGITFKDNMFAKNCAKAKVSGIKVGAYHFFHPDKDATAQFKNFKDALHPYSFNDLELIPCVDWEAHKGTSEQGQYDRLKEFCEIIEKNLGVKPLIYTGKWYVDQVDALSSVKRPQWLASYPLWLSWYSKKPVPQVAPWGDYTVLQWTGDVNIPELGNKPFDLNVMMGESLEPILRR